MVEQGLEYISRQWICFWYCGECVETIKERLKPLLLDLETHQDVKGSLSKVRGNLSPIVTLKQVSQMDGFSLPPHCKVTVE